MGTSENDQNANFAITEFSEVRSGRSCIPILQLFEQTLYQEPVNFVYPDPTAHVLHGKLYLVGSCAAVPHLQMANIVQVHVQHFGEGRYPCAYLLPTAHMDRWPLLWVRLGLPQHLVGDRSCVALAQ